MTGERILTIPNFSAGFSIIWGCWVLWPWVDMFDLNPRIYGPMLSLVPYESFWGALFLLAGVATWVLSYYGHKYKGALILFVAYAFFASLYFFGDARSPGWVLYGYTSLVHFMFWGANRGKYDTTG